MAAKKTTKKKASRKKATRKRRASKPRASKAKRLEALAIYAVTGNASAAAREVAQPDRSVRRWVAAALSGEDPEGAELLAGSGRDLRARIIDQVERGLGPVIDKTIDRINDDAWAGSFKGDPTPQYITALSNTYSKLIDAEKLAAQRSGEIAEGTTVVVLTHDDAEVTQVEDAAAAER